MISLENIWPEWKIEKQIGRGSFGIVYQAVRQDENSLIRRAAIKVISIPQDPYEIEMLRADGMDRNACHTYIKNIVDDSVNEIRLMESLQEDSQNIVRIEDYKVMEKTATIGWDIYIRMELLTPFNVYICDKKMSEQEVIQLGCDICNALEVCERCKIIHRDIKPENIFINKLGCFKIGDFGTARTLESLTVSLSQKGTYNYMAPEVFKGELYDARVDIYSLGIVLYRLLNGNRLPFLSEKQLLSPAERRTALDRRLGGEKLPAPSEASASMAEVIVQSCAFEPDERFSSAAELREALQKLDKDFNSKAVPDLIHCGEKPVAAKRFLQVSMIVFSIIFLTGCMWFVFKKEYCERK